MFNVNFDGRHKARLVADGHLTPEPNENMYSGVVSLRNLKLVIFLGKLNHLELWGADIRNAYLEAFTDEKLYIAAGPEFQELEGYILIFLKALYGLKSIGKRWAEVIHGILRDMKFLPSKADPCIWLRKASNLRCYDTIYIKTQVFRLLRYYSPAPRNISRSDWATQNITHNMTSSIIQPHGLHSP